nr:fibronectin type III domain-containing protein [Paenibacillus roseus]
MSLALVGTDLSIPSSLPNTEYFLEFSSPKLNLVYKDLAPPTQPSNLKVTALTSNSVSLSWGASVDNSKTVYYQIIRNGSVITTYYTNSYTVSGLNENTKYTFSIRAMDSSNNLSSESNSVTITTGTHKPIANFLNLSENGIYSNPILINWSYFDPTGKKLTAYEIKGSTDNWATTEFDTGVLAVTTPVEFSTNLLPSKPWSLAIRAYNESGAGDWSYINNIRTNWNVEYIYDSAGRIDYIILSGKIKLDYEYDINGNLIRTVKTTL